MLRLRTSLYALLVFSLLSLGLNPAFASDDRFIDVVSVSWPGAPATNTKTSELESAINNEVKKSWNTFTTLQGDTKNRNINFSHGKTLNETLQLQSPMACSGNTASSFMSSIQIETYKRLGISDWGSRYLIILVPNVGCIWMGRALIGSNEYPGGVLTVQDSANAFVITHELGHTLGLGHSNFLRCNSGAKDGAWGSDCKGVEYGGTIDVMGNVETNSSLSTYHQWRMGLLDREEIYQSWVTEEVELSASDVIDKTRAIFIRDGKSTYWIEYRRPNSGNSYNPGLVIFRTDPPPANSVVTPNTDLFLSDPSMEIGSDIWMLNWDSYSYISSRASGSMTLPQGQTATVYSGKISISATAGIKSDSVKVRITQRGDTTPPPTPKLTDPDTWRFPGIEVISRGYDDGESTIKEFEAQIDGKIQTLSSSTPDKWVPTYLNPFTSPKTVLVKDLPEGNYSLAIRSVDIWGNKSDWSRPVNVVVDRGYPTVTPSLRIDAIKQESLDLTWTGAKDDGSGLCLTQFANQDGFVSQSSTEKSAPKLSIPRTGALQAKLYVFDCLGNGVTGDVNLSSDFLSANKAKRTGKWSKAPSLGDDALRCTGKCSASFSTKGNVSILMGSGAADVLVTSKKVTSIPNSTSDILRLGGNVDLGASNKVLRISGANFTLIGVARVDFALTNKKEIARNPSEPDDSLSDATQRELAKMGFTQNDFTADWTVNPMARGTTLQDPTLDLCKIAYASESDRQSRRQLTANKRGSDYLFLSTEVVRYKSEAAAASAKSEVQRAIENCRTDKGFTNATGILVPHEFLPIPASVEKSLADRKQIVVHASIKNDSSPMLLLGFYQYSGAKYTGLYLVKSSTKPFTDAEILRWSEVAKIMWERLNKA